SDYPCAMPWDWGGSCCPPDLLEVERREFHVLDFKVGQVDDVGGPYLGALEISRPFFLARPLIAGVAGEREVVLSVDPALCAVLNVLNSGIPFAQAVGR